MFHGTSDITRAEFGEKKYVGVVVDNNDPDKLFRVKVRVFDVHRGLADEVLPWARPEESSIIFGRSPEIGDFVIPVLGTIVNVTFQNGDLYNPLYSQATIDGKTNITIFHEDYPHTWGFTDPSGNLLKVNNLKNTYLFQHASGTNIEIDGSGRVRIQVADKKVAPEGETKFDKGITVEVMGDLHLLAKNDTKIETQGNTKVITSGTTEITSQGAVNIGSSSTINMSGSRINLNTSRVAVAVPKVFDEPKERKRPDELDPSNKTNL